MLDTVYYSVELKIRTVESIYDTEADYISQFKELQSITRSSVFPRFKTLLVNQTGSYIIWKVKCNNPELVNILLKTGGSVISKELCQ